MSDKKFIDVDKIIREKAPGLRKWLPGLIIRWLKRKLHENEINEFMRVNKDVHGLAFNKAALDTLGANIEVKNKHHVPLSGGVIVAANHPLGGLDGMALINAVGDIRKDVRFLVNDVLLSLKNYGDVFVGINKVGSISTKSLRSMEDVMLTEDAILFFPAGLVSRQIQGKIMDLEWKKSFVTQAIDHKRQIVPTFIEGGNSKFFYRFANLRKKLGIKANIEMLFLPDEMFKQKGHTVKIHFGKPFDPSLLDTSKSHREWASHIKKYIYSQEFKQGVSFEDFIKK